MKSNYSTDPQFTELSKKIDSLEAELKETKRVLKSYNESFAEIRRYASAAEESMKKIFGGKTFLPLVKNILRIIREKDFDRDQDV